MERKVRTVLGDIKPEEMGFTSMHDHAFPDLGPSGEFMASILPGIQEDKLVFKPENYDYLKNGMFLLNKELQKVDDVDGVVNEYNYFVGIGGKTLVETTPTCLRGSIDKFIELSKRTGLNVICSTGFYHEFANPAELRGKDMDFYYQYMKKEVEEGIEGTEVRPGMIKVALNTCSENERSIVEAGMKLGGETGMPVHVHTEPSTPGEAIAEILDGNAAKYGVEADKIHICHMDSRLLSAVPVTGFLTTPEVQREINLDTQIMLMDKGYTIGLDTWGMHSENPYMFMPDDYDRLKALVTLIDKGYGDQITLGNDFCNKLQWRAYGGLGCTRFAEFGGMMMGLLGRTDQFTKLVVDNPARIMSF